MNLRPTAKAKKKKKMYQQQWLFLEPPWFFSEPTGTWFFSEFEFIYFFKYHFKVRRYDILAFHFIKIVGYKTHPDFGPSKIWFKKCCAL